MHQHAATQQIPPVAITMGCPAGIGPEIICRLFQQHPAAVSHTVVIGDQGTLIQAASQLGLALNIRPWRAHHTLHSFVSIHIKRSGKQKNQKNYWPAPRGLFGVPSCPTIKQRLTPPLLAIGWGRLRIGLGFAVDLILWG